jgi:hypothetical protein
VPVKPLIQAATKRLSTSSFLTLSMATERLGLNQVSVGLVTSSLVDVYEFHLINIFYSQTKEKLIINKITLE